MIAFGEGRLKIGNNNITDGIIFYKSISPSLRRIMRHKKRDLSIVGQWWTFNNWLFWFKKVR